MIYFWPSESRATWQEKEEKGPFVVLNAYSWATGASSSSYQGSGPILQGISKQAMGSRRQNTDEPPSTQAPATQGWELSRVLSFQYKSFTHFNGHYNFKESNFQHCLSSAAWFVERGSFCMNSTQKLAFPLAEEGPVVFKPSKLQVRLQNYLSFQGDVFRHARRPDQTEFNHKQDLHTEKIVPMKGKRRTKEGKKLHKCSVIISGCPIYLTLTIPSCHREEENMFSSPKRGDGGSSMTQHCKKCERGARLLFSHAGPCSR